VLFRVAAGPRTGFGHLQRALSLSRALHVPPVMSIRGSSATLRAARRLGVRVVDGSSARNILLRQRPRILIIDDREARATAPWRRAARGLGVPIVSIHDLGIGFGDADLIVDGSLTAQAPAGVVARVLIGTSYAILGRTARAGPRRPAAGESVVIALGGGRRRGLAVRLARALRVRRPAAEVLVAGGFSATGRQRGPAGIRWIRPDGLSDALRQASVAIVGGGVTLYESCALGVPTVGIAVVASQVPTVTAFAARGAIIGGGLASGRGDSPAIVVTRVVGEVVNLLQDGATRRRLASAAASLVDRRGAERVATAIRRLWP
jgi:spore coat polysaccharide biosynthesis predicted glycosyltransferase SpsG